MRKIILMVLLVLFCSPSFAGLEMNPITGKLDKTNDTNVTEIVSDVWEEQGNNVYLIDTSQNVGIGTINPAGKLHVAGPFVVEGDFSGVLLDYGQKIDGDTSRKITFSDTVGTYNSNLRLDLDTTSGVASFDSSSTVPIEEVEFVDMTVTATAFVGDGSGLTGISGGGSVGWTDGGTNVYATTTSDRVAIGTTTPSVGSKLQVVGTVSATAFVGDGSGLTGIVGGGGLGNVVEDTTPQLGGDLDMNGNSIDFPSTANISDVLDEDNMASNSATKLATQQSIKAYVDTAISGVSGGAGGWTDGGTNIYNTTTTDNIGIGTTIPSSNLMIKGGTGNGLKIVNSASSGSSAGAGIQAHSDDNAAVIQGDRLGFYTFGGSADTGDTINNGAAISGFADGTYSASSAPTEIRFETAPSGSTTRSARMYVKSDGTVGIGTSNPQSTLQVSGDTKVGNGTFSNSSANEDLYVEGNLEVDGTIYGSLSGNASTVTTNANLTGDVTSSGNTATIADSVTVTGWALGASTATTPSGGDNDTSLATTAYVQTELSGLGSGGWTDGTAVIYTTTSTDNVGIGTFNPLQRLQVVGTVQATTFVTNSTSAGSLVLNEASANGSNTITISAPSSVASDRSCALEDDSTPFDNCVSATSSGWTDAGATINVTTSTDNVGIGTSSPEKKLVLAGADSDMVIRSSTNSAFTEMAMQNDAGEALIVGASGTAASGGLQGYVDMVQDGPLHLLTNDTARVTITGSGNVGIGSTTPTGALDIRSTASSIGWTVVDQTDNQACNTGCSAGCVFGFENATGTAVTNIVSCAATTADLCLCAGSN